MADGHEQAAAGIRIIAPRRHHGRRLLGQTALAGILALTTSPAAIRAAAATTPAAQTTGPETGPSSGGYAEQVTVTARTSPFRFAREQHVGNAATHITAQALIERHVTTITDLQRLAPNLTVQTQGGSSAVNFNLRGIGLADFTQNNTPAVMTYIDGVAYPVSQTVSGLLFDLAGAEIVPGPAGFTHGTAVAGGEVNLTTADPTDQFHAGVLEDIASYARNKTSLYVSGPLSQTVQFRLSGESVEGGAYQYDHVTGQRLGVADQGGLRGKLNWEPDAQTLISLTAHWSQDNSDNTEGDVLLNLSGHPIPTGGFYGTGWGLSPGFAKLIGIDPDSKPGRNNLSWGSELNMSRDLGWGSLTSTTAYEMLERHEYIDGDASAFNIADEYLNNQTNVFSQELRLTSKPDAGPLEWIVGAYYDRIRNNASFYFDFSQLPGRGYYSETQYHQPQQNFSQYGQLTYKVLPKLRVTFGVNHDSDDRQLVNLTTTHFGHSNLDFQNSGALTNQFSGKVGVDYQMQSNALLYADIRKGVNPGGFTANNTVLAEQLQPFKPETVLAYEAGVKSEFLDHKLRLNATAFYDDFRDQQILGVVVVPVYGPLGRYVNAPRSNIWGIEGEMDYSPIRNLKLTQVFGWQRGVYDMFQSINLPAVEEHYVATHQWVSLYKDYRGVDTGIPKLSLTGSISYLLHPSPGYSLSLESDYSYRGAQDTTPGGTGIYVLPAYFLLNGSITVRPNKGPWSVAAYASNLLGRQYYLSSYGATSDVTYGIPGPPRFFGARLSYTY